MNAQLKLELYLRDFIESGATHEVVNREDDSTHELTIEASAESIVYGNSEKQFTYWDVEVEGQLFRISLEKLR